MKYILSIGLVTLLAGCGFIKTPMPTEDMIASVKDGTVLISNKIDDASGGTGTGFIIDDNTIITNNHVIAGQNNVITVYSPESLKKYPAKVLYTDPIADVAIVQLDDWKLYKKEQNPTILVLGDSDSTRVGSKIVAIGHPWGLTWSASEGIISAKNRREGPNPKYLDQIDAYVYPGNSGGPVFNEYGQVVCVNEIMYKGESGGGSYGMCIPSNLVKKIVYDLENFKEVRWRALNVTIGLTDDGSSVIINNVEPNGAADKAGIKVDDKVIKVYTKSNQIDGILVKKPDDIITTIARLKGDEDTVELLIDRNGKLTTIPVKTNYRLSNEYEPDKAK